MRASTELSGTWSRMSCPKKAAAAEIAPGGVVGDLVVTFPDKKFGYSGLTNDRDSLDRCAMDTHAARPHARRYRQRQAHRAKPGPHDALRAHRP